jgi:hypothetical protein
VEQAEGSRKLAANRAHTLCAACIALPAYQCFSSTTGTALLYIYMLFMLNNGIIAQPTFITAERDRLAILKWSCPGSVRVHLCQTAAVGPDVGQQSAKSL